MRTFLACLVLLAMPSLTMAQSGNDPLGVEVNADSNMRALWERYYDTIVTACTCTNGMTVYRQTTLRQYLNEGNALATKARLLETFVSAPTAMRLLSSCH